MRVLTGLILVLIASFGPLAATAAESAPAGVRVEQPWARASIGTARPAAAYLTLVNDGTEAVMLVGADAAVAERAEIHETIKEDKMMRMLPAATLTIPAGARISMAPGGYHVMLTGLKQPLEKGGTLRLTLHFAGGAALDVAAPVLGPGAMGPGK